MTSHHLPPHDEDDDQDLRALYRKLPRTEPSARLDAAVKQVAARAAEADRKVQQPRRRWHPGWGVAATVVLVTGLFLLTELNHPEVAQLADAPPIDAHLTAPPETTQPGAAAKTEAPATMSERSRAATMRPKSAPAPAPAPAFSARPEPAMPSAESSADQALATVTRSDAPTETAARIAHIRDLLRQGQREKALQALRDLQRDEPDLMLPADLEQLLPKQP